MCWEHSKRCTPSINFAGTLRMATLAGDLESRLNGLAAGATILATVCCQTTAAWVCTPATPCHTLIHPRLRADVGLPDEVDS